MLSLRLCTKDNVLKKKKRHEVRFLWNLLEPVYCEAHSSEKKKKYSDDVDSSWFCLEPGENGLFRPFVSETCLSQICLDSSISQNSYLTRLDQFVKIISRSFSNKFSCLSVVLKFGSAQ